MNLGTMPYKVLLKEFELAIMERSQFFKETKENYYPESKAKRIQEIKNEIFRRMIR